MSYAAPTLDQDISGIERELAQLDRLAKTLDSRFRLPGTTIRFGFDTLVGLIPGIGDTLMAAPSAWIIWRAYRMGIRRRHLTRMIANSGIDYVVGSIPVIGDIFDVGFKANLRNIAILRDELVAKNLTQGRGRNSMSTVS